MTDNVVESHNLKNTQPAILTRRTALLGMAATAAALSATSLLPSEAQARKASIYTGLLSGTAVGGYDPVAYFKSGKPVKGSRKHTTQYMGATWRFSSAKNLAAFKASPSRYAPAYGGYCAWAVAQGYTAKGDPRHWKIVGGKLYLNYSAGVQSKWAKDISGNIRKANKNWPKVLN